MKKLILTILLLLNIISPCFAKYFYQSKLSESENIAYVDIVKTLLIENEAEVEISNNLNESQINEIYKAINYDLPQLFFIDSNYEIRWIENANNEKIKTSLLFNFKNYKEGLNFARADVQKQAQDIANSISSLDSDYEKVLKIYEYFTLSNQYDITTASDQSCYSVLVDKKGVCASFARAFQYVMGLLNVNCIFVTGTLNGVPHAWNMVEIDNSWYHVDATNANSGIKGVVDYQYLLIPTDKMMKAVTIDDLDALPVANSDRFNYYKMNNQFFEKYDRNIISKAINSNKNNKVITFEFKSPTELDNAVKDLIKNQQIYPIVNTSKIQYFINEKRNLITINY